MDDVWTVAVAGSSHGDGFLIYWTCHTEEAAKACYAEQVSYGQATMLFRGPPLKFSQYNVTKHEPTQVAGSTPPTQA